MNLETCSGAAIGMMFGTGASSHKDLDGLRAVISAALAGGIRGFDTAPSYKTEGVLGKCLAQGAKELGLDRSELFVQTKIDAWQMAEGGAKIEGHVADAMREMRLDYLDALLVHWPVPEYFKETWERLAELKERGWVRYIGVCNVRMRQLAGFPRLPAPPDAIQLERHPLRTCDGEIAFCRENSMAVQAYSPLCKMHEDIRTNATLLEIAERHGKSVGQIVLRWHMDCGVIPVFTSKKESRIREYAELADFSLAAEEVAAVNSMNRNYKMYLESFACPGF